VWGNVSATLRARQSFNLRPPALTTTHGFFIGCALGLISATGVADAGALSGKVALQFGPYVHHWSPEPEHNNAPWLVGLEYESPARWIAGASWLRNSFDQSTEYYYVGRSWRIDAISSRLYVKVTAGALLGYSGEYEDKIPLNHKGVALAVIPALGYQVDRYNAQLALLGTAGFMITFGMDLFSW
jgi:hypothetical protein